MLTFKIITTPTTLTAPRYFGEYFSCVWFDIPDCFDTRHYVYNALGWYEVRDIDFNFHGSNLFFTTLLNLYVLDDNVSYYDITHQ